MLRPLDDLVRLARRRLPGGRSRLAYRVLQAVVVPEPAVLPARTASRAGRPHERTTSERLT